jgi:ATP-binding cassette subfamily B protein/subfamily B ATP-binding cassette protein MsbA
MKSLQTRLRGRLLQSQEERTDALPGWLRVGIRSTAGGNEWTATFIRGLFWKYRWLILVAVAANVATGFAEAATLAVFTLALNQMAELVTGATSSQVDTGGTINTIATQVANFFGLAEPIFVLLLLSVLLQLTRSLLDYSGQATTVYLRIWMESDLQRRIFTQLMGMRYQQVIDKRLGNLASYTNQVADIGLIVQAFNQVLNDAILIITYIAVLFYISWQFTLVAVLVLLLFSLGLNHIREGIRQSSARYLKVSVNLNERVVEFLQSIRVVHIFVRERMAVDEFNRLVNTGIPLRRKGLLRRATLTPLIQSLFTIGVTAFLALAYWGISTGRLSNVGELVAYIFVIYRIMPRISTLNGQLGIIANQWPFAVRLAEILNPADKELEYLPGKNITTLHASIEFRNVTLRYPGSDRDALHQLSFTIPKGSMVAVVGSSGSGKSTLVNLLLGLYWPTAGEILVDGAKLQSYDLAAWRTLIGVVDQDTAIFSTSVADNIRFGKPDATDEEVIQAARTANAHDFIQAMPQGYATEVGDRGFRLSGGQRQRIAIARAVIHDPALLLFDEATSALDSHSEQLIQASLEELRKERTLLVIAHRLSTIAKADKIIVLDNGEIVEQGTHTELLALYGRYAAMWRLQAGATA